MKSTICLLVLLIHTNGFAQEEPREQLVDQILFASSLTSGFGDKLTTMYYIGKGTVHETNPIFTPFVNNPVMFTLVGGGSEVLINLGAYKIHKTHPKWARVILISNTVFKSYLMIRNYKIGSAVK